MPASVASPLLSTLPIQLLSSPLPSCLALWPASLTAEQACFYKAAVKRGESRYGRSWGLFRRSKILNRIVIGWFTLSMQETNQWATDCSLSLHDGSWQKKKKKSVGPFSASAHRENARYARLPVQPWLYLAYSCVLCTCLWHDSMPHSHVGRDFKSRARQQSRRAPPAVHVQASHVA